jgi:hypothetical protein
MEDEFGFKGASARYLDSRRADEKTIAKILRRKNRPANTNAMRVLTYSITVDGSYCESDQTLPVCVTGRQTRPDAYQFHVKNKLTGHHVYNSHHLPTPDDWHIIGPVVGRVGKEEGAVGMAVVQNLRRISYDVPEESM